MTSSKSNELKKENNDLKLELKEVTDMLVTSKVDIAMLKMDLDMERHRSREANERADELNRQLVIATNELERLRKSLPGKLFFKQSKSIDHL